MYIHAIACTLPDGRNYLAFHSHTDESKCVWRKGDRDTYFSVLDKVREVYRLKKDVPGLKDNQIPMFMPEGMDLETALQRVVPYRITADRITKNTQFLSASADDVNKVDTAGVDELEGIRFVALVKECNELKPTATFLKWSFDPLIRKGLDVRARNEMGDLVPIESWQPGMDVLVDKYKLDFDDLRFRSMPTLLAVVRNREPEKIIREGRLKIVAIPNEVEVDLIHTRGGEILREKARIWK